MRVNLEWLREWVNVEFNGDALADRLTTAGLEVDEVVSVASGMAGVLVARVESVEKHPAADRLSVCRVNDGSELHDVVCGAPNVAAGITVPFAPVGAELPGGQEIRAAKLRGVTSRGMLCSGKELGLSDDSSGLMLLDSDAPLGESLMGYLRLDDAVLDIDLTPNRGDCFSVVGIAREIAAFQAVPLQGPTLGPVAATSSDTFSVELHAPAACPRFAGRVVRGIEADAESPIWMKERLRRAGVRAISPVVDVTNYVMLELGQPLHAYDLAALDEKIVVRFAKQGERLVLLDGKEIELEDDVLIIADANRPVGMAGIMGGAGTSVSETTRDVLLEAAFFSPEAVSGRARRYGLHTDASLRFERGVDPEGTARAVERATELLLSIAGGEPGPINVTEYVDSVPKRNPILLRHARAESVLGMNLDQAQLEASLVGLQLQLQRDGDAWWVTPPSFRFDLAIEEDLIEEVGRMIGYDKIPTVTGQVSAHLGQASETSVSDDRVADFLVDRGYNEVITYSFIDEQLELLVNPDTVPLALVNPISTDLAVMRRSLWPGLLRAAEKNLSRQIYDFRLFEYGPQFTNDNGLTETLVIAGLVTGERVPEHWDGKSIATDFYDVKSDVEAAIDLTRQPQLFSFVAAEHPALRPGQSARILRESEMVGWIGALHPRIQQALDIKQPVYLFALQFEKTFCAEVPSFASVSKYPFVRRDIAVIVREDLSADEITAHVRAVAGPLLQDLIVFDIYRGPGIDATGKSVALGLILQDASRTLTDIDADDAVGTITQHLQRELGAKIRT